MSNMQIVQEARGAMTHFEPLTPDILQFASQGEMSYPEFCSLLEQCGLSAEFVMHDPTRQFLSTFYADYAHGIYLELYLTEQYLRESIPTRLQSIRLNDGVVQELAAQNWKNFYFKQVPVPMLIYDFQQRYRDIPAEQVFSIWYDIYKRIDYSNNMWQPEVLDYVFSLAPTPQLPAAADDGLITLYRGMGELSQKPEQAISWSSHPGNALWFAVHFARGTHIAVARVRPEVIVAYRDGFRNENEAIVRPGSITDYYYEDMIPALADTVPKLMVPAVPEYVQYGKLAQALGYQKELTPFQVHGLQHILRVLLLSLIYYYNSADPLTEADKQILIYFSLLHDLGRTTEGVDTEHGDASVKLIHTKGIRLKGIRLSHKDFRIAELLIRLHCCNDQAGFDAIQAQHNLSRKEKERIKHLLSICKDMDGLDRVRFNGLDYRMLRTKYGRRLPLVAGCLLEENMTEALQYDLEAGNMETRSTAINP